MFTDYYPKRKSIRAILFDHEDRLVFLGLRQPGKPVVYLTFGGGVEEQEVPEETLRREIIEELDAEAVIGREFLGLHAV